MASNPYDQFINPYSQFTTDTTEPFPEEEAVEPFPYKPWTRPEQTVGPDGKVITTQVDMTPENYKRAAAAGVDITTGGPGGFLASFPTTIAGKQHAHAIALKQELGYEPEMQIDPTSGLQVYRPKGSTRWIAVDPMRALGNPANIAGSLIEGVSSTVGAVAGALGMAPIGPGGAAVGGAGGGVAGAATGRALRRKTGKALGAIEDDESVWSTAGEAANEAVVGELATLGLLGVGKGVKWAFRGGAPFTVEEATLLLNEQRRTEKLIEEIERGSGHRFNITAAQAAYSRDSAIRGDRAHVVAAKGQGFAQTDERVGTDLKTLKESNEVAMTDYFSNLFKQYREQALGKQQASGQLVEATIDPYVIARQMADDIIKQLPADVGEETAARVIRESLEAAKKEFETTVVRPAWDNYNRLIDFNPTTFSSGVRIPVTDEVLNDLRGLEKAWKAEAQALRSQVGATQEVAVPPSLRIPKAKGRITQDGVITITENPTVDIATVVRRIQELRSGFRSSLSGDTGVRLDNKKMYDLERNLTKVRDQWLEQNNPDVKQALDAAEGATKLSVQKFNRGLSERLLVLDSDGALRFNDGATLQAILKSNDKATVREFADVIKGHPEAKGQVNQVLLGLYRKYYTKNGIPTPERHAQFLKHYGNVVDVFFDPAQAQTVRQMGGLAEVVHKEWQTLRKIVPTLRGASGLPADVLAPEDLINATFKGTLSPKQVDMVLTNLNKYQYKDEVIQQWKGGLSEEIYRSLLDKQGNVDFNRLHSLLNNQDRMEAIKRVFSAGGFSPTAAGDEGEVLVRGLEMLRKARELVHAQSITGLNPKAATALTDLQRVTYAQPLTRAGVAVTALQRNRRRAAPEAVYKALTDPKEMEKLTKRIQRNIRIITFATGFGTAPVYDD